MIELERWAKQTPGRRNAHDVLTELDAIQRGVDAGEAAERERRRALDVLVRRGVLSKEAAAAAALAPIGGSASGVAKRSRPAPTAISAREAANRPADPGAVVGAALVVLAPIALAAMALLDAGLVAAYWASTGLLLTGEAVLAATAGRGQGGAGRRLGRLSPAAIAWIAAAAALSPVLVIGTALADPVEATIYAGAFFAAQCMMVLGLVALAEIARTQDWRARGGRSADARIERGEPVRVDPGAFLGVALVVVAPFVAAASLFTALPPVPGAWTATAVLVAGAIVLGATAGRADSLAPSRRGRLSSRALVWIVVAAAVTPVVQFAVILANLDGPGAAMRICLSAQSIVVVAMILLPMIARRQERGGPLRD